MNLMNLNPKVYIGAAILFLITSIIGAYFAIERHSSLVTERAAHVETQEELDLKEAFITLSEAQRKRALSSRTVTKPVLLGGQIANEITTETTETDESKTQEYTSLISQLETTNLRLSQEVDRLSKLETSKSGVKRWGTLAKYNFPHWEAGLGVHQDLGIVDLGLYGLLSIPAVNQYSVALNARF